MTVTPLDPRRQRRSADLAVAVQRHPAGQLLGGNTVHVAVIDRAHALETLCRRWDETAASFSVGPDCLEADEAEELLQFLCASVVHPYAIEGLVFQLPQLREAVTQCDAVRDGDIHPTLLGTDSYDVALGKARAELDWQLSPLVHGLPARDMCPDCVRTRPSVSTWQTRRGCPDHTQAL